MNPIYEENAKLIKEFYKSDFGKKYMQQPFFKYMIEAIYNDPDKFDKKLKNKAKEYAAKFQIEFSPDGICGWKLLFDLYKGNESTKWIDIYKKLRKSSIGTLFWPCKEAGGLTINVERSFIFADRIDLTLYDIKRYIEGNTPKMKFNNIDTQTFLNRYKKKEGFTTFITDFNLNMFVNEQNEIYNLKEKEYKTTFINDGICDNFSYSPRWKYDDKKKAFGNYIENILEIAKKSNVEA